MKKTVPFLMLGLMAVSITVSTFILTKEALTESNAEYETLLLINTNQVIQKRVAATTQLSEASFWRQSSPIWQLPKVCSRSSNSKHFPIIYM